MPFSELAESVLETILHVLGDWLFQSRWGWIGLSLVSVIIFVLARSTWPEWYAWVLLVAGLAFSGWTIYGVVRWRRGADGGIV